MVKSAIPGNSTGNFMVVPPILLMVNQSHANHTKISDAAPMGASLAQDELQILRDSKVVVLVVYVDDIIITGNDELGIVTVKSYLHQHFQMKDLGPLRYFLGIEVLRSKKGISLSQRKYMMDPLSKTGMLASTPVDTPMDPHHKLEADDGEDLEDKHQYRRLVGKLIYLIVTRPDISFAVGVISEFMQPPKKPHWEVACRILRYLKGAPGKGLIYKSHQRVDLVGFSDADWAGFVGDRRFTTGYCTFFWRKSSQLVQQETVYYG
ncbi:uncharacterized mitochondrial protein AtMg00810-like [Telopea speciosissima]|uniref:uncharacterized mitochondrial protein AtMg00810-like n=1 Tax=Telopea speciosissima TaxID=54955 RepID=UPI001CC6B318|nr:uncharacterized mitochondrial protein AtMg00810-like [Telopea speciosissima]